MIFAEQAFSLENLTGTKKIIIILEKKFSQHTANVNEIEIRYSTLQFLEMAVHEIGLLGRCMQLQAMQSGRKTKLLA